MKRITVFVVALVFCTLMFLGCKNANQQSRIDLSTGWSYNLKDPADYPDNFLNLPDEKLSNLESIVPGMYGSIWLKKTFRISETLKNQDLACYLGRITLADKTYFNGTLIGHEGYFPPKEFSAWNSARFYELPENIINWNGENTMLIEVFVDGEGSIVSSPFIGQHDDCKKAAAMERFWNSKIHFLFAFLMIIISVYHLIIWFNHRIERENLYFAIINLVSAAYLSVLFYPELPIMSANHISFLAFQKIFSSGMLFALIFIINSFVNAFLKRKDNTVVLTIRIIFLMIPLVLILFARNYVQLRMLRNWIQFLLIPPMLYIFFLTIRACIKKQKDALPLLIGFSPFVISGVLDVILHDLCGFYSLPYFSSIGWQLVIIALLFVLANRFSNTRKEAEYLNVHLTDEVQARTKELSESNNQLTLANEELEAAKIRAENDMKLAVHVQQSFFPRCAPKLQDWEIAYTFKPMSGVSGDLYDFFSTGGKLNGIALFDVSGHGISSGLVTMLAKTVIAKNFSSDMNIKLSTVMKNINNSIVEEKGSVENYLTGLLVRTDGTKVQLVNAGHPEVFYRSAKTGKTFPVQLKDDENKAASCFGGIVGIPGMDVDFNAVQFNMNPGDALIMYTDCLSESRNAEGKDFTTDGISKAFSESGNGSAQSKLDNVLNSFNNYTRGVPLNDDLTVIVLQKN